MHYPHPEPMKTKKSYIILGLIVMFGLIQFIRPERNLQTNPSRYDVFHKTSTDAKVVSLVQGACYDCHSNRTAYPWYASVAPVSWIVNQGVVNGKKKMNFSEWILYPQDRRLHKLDEIIEVLEQSEMPPKPYQWMHKNAVLAPENTQLIINWAKVKKAEEASLP